MVLKEYLSHYGEIEDDEDFEAWYMQRHENAESEAHYKNTLYLAQCGSADTRRDSWQASHTSHVKPFLQI